MFRITFTSLLYCLHFEGAQLTWTPLMQAVGAPAGRLLFIKVPSALEATQHNPRWEKQPGNNRNIPLLGAAFVPVCRSCVIGPQVSSRSRETGMFGSFSLAAAQCHI